MLILLSFYFHTLLRAPLKSLLNIRKLCLYHPLLLLPAPLPLSPRTVPLSLYHALTDPPRSHVGVDAARRSQLVHVPAVLAHASLLAFAHPPLRSLLDLSQLALPLLLLLLSFLDGVQDRVLEARLALALPQEHGLQLGDALQGVGGLALTSLHELQEGRGRAGGAAREIGQVSSVGVERAGFEVAGGEETGLVKVRVIIQRVQFGLENASTLL